MATTLTFEGHATFVITADDGSTLIIDPYDSGVFGDAFRYKPLEGSYDYAVTSHDHVDHNAVERLSGSPAAPSAPFTVTRHQLAHDEYDGRRRGGSVDALVVEVDGITIVHLSDVGHSPRPSDVEALKRCDCLIVPCGGFYTIGAAQAQEWVESLRPRVAVPMHYLTKAIALPLIPVEVFLARFPTCTRAGVNSMNLASSDATGVVVLEPRSA